MAGMRAVHKKNGTTFKYSGDLKETIEKAERKGDAERRCIVRRGSSTGKEMQ